MMTLANKIGLAAIAGASVLFLMMGGKAEATHNIVSAMNTSRVQSLSDGGSLVTVAGLANANLPGDVTRTEWYQSVAAMEYIDENGAHDFVTKINQDSTTVKDNFNRSNEDPLSNGGKWARADTSAFYSMKLVSNAATNSASGTSYSYWNQDSYAGGAGSVWAKISCCNSSSAVGVALLKDVGGSNAVDGYAFMRETSGIADNDYLLLRKLTNGVQSALPDTCSSSCNPGEDNAGVEGGPYVDDIYLNIRRNGPWVEGWTSEDNVTWNRAIWVQDTSYTSGTFYPSILSVGSTNTLDDFGIGPIGLIDEPEDAGASVTDDGDNLTSGEVSSQASTNAAAVGITVQSTYHLSFFDGMAEVVYKLDGSPTQASFLENYQDNFATLVDGLLFTGKPLAIVIQDSSGNNIVVQGTIPTGDGASSSVAWQAEGVAAWAPNPTIEQQTYLNESGNSYVFRAQQTAPDPDVDLLARGQASGVEVVSTDLNPGQVFYSGIRSTSDPDANGLGPGLIGMYWVKSNGQAGITLGEDGPYTTGPCISPTTDISSGKILLEWQVKGDVYECLLADVPSGYTWGQGSIFILRNIYNPPSETKHWRFEIDALGCYVVGCVNGLTLGFEVGKPEQASGYIGTAPDNTATDFGTNACPSCGAHWSWRAQYNSNNTDPGASATFEVVLATAQEQLGGAAIWTPSWTYTFTSVTNYGDLDANG